MSAPNREILEALQTAVSAKKPEWLDAVGAKVSDRRAKQEMSDSEFKAVNSIIDIAKAGKWKDALKASFALSEGQRPTSEDLAMLKDRRFAKKSVPSSQKSTALQKLPTRKTS